LGLTPQLCFHFPGDFTYWHRMRKGRLRHMYWDSLMTVSL
jgi:hypothetical protein